MKNVLIYEKSSVKKHVVVAFCIAIRVILTRTQRHDTFLLYCYTIYPGPVPLITLYAISVLFV